jgi:hypothetical protein
MSEGDIRMGTKQVQNIKKRTPPKPKEMKTNIKAPKPKL